MAHLFASIVTRIFASKETMAGTATYLPQWAWKSLSHNLTAPNSNGLCKRMNDEYEEDHRILRQIVKTSNWVQLNDYVVICMNHKQRGKSGYSRGDVFHGRPTPRLGLSFPHEGNVQVQDRSKNKTKLHK